MTTPRIANQKPVSKKPVKKKRRFLRTFFFASLWLIVCAVSLFAGYYKSMPPIVQTMLKKAPTYLFSPPDPTQEFSSNQVTFLVMGADVDIDNHKRVIKDRARSDVMLLLRCDFTKGQESVKGISIPRDTMVDIPGYKRQKINAAHAIGGPDLARSTVENLLGITIDHTVTLDYVGFQRVIDSVGGLMIDVDKKMDYDDNWGNLHIHLKPGYQWLNGKQAMGYVRFRHTDDDFHRVKRQQAFAAAFKEQLKKQSLTQVPELLQKVRDSFETTTSDEQLIALAAWVHSLKPTAIQMDTLPVIELNPSALALDEARAEELLQRMNFKPSYLNYYQTSSQDYQRNGSR